MSRWWTLRREVIGESEDEAVAIMRWAVEVSAISPCEMGRRLGWSKQSVHDYMTGKRPRPGWGVMMRWLRACGLRVIVDGEGRRDDD